jgi:hypothetical protein
LGKLVRYGYALMIDTANQIGPTVADPAKRYSGNNLTCESCHLQAGTQPYAIPLVGVWGQFPQYRGREGKVGTLEDRINGCMDRSMNGRVLPLASHEMRAYLAFNQMALGRYSGWRQVTGGGHFAGEGARTRRGSRAWETGLRASLRGLPQRQWIRTACRERRRLSVPTALGIRHL